MAEPLPINYPGFEGRGLALRPSGFVQGAAIISDGKAATRKGRTFTLSDNAGAPVTFRLKGNILDPIPAVVVGDQTIRLARPFAWYEWVWVVLPLVLVPLGGGLGGLCGGVAMLVNARLLRSARPAWVRYGLGTLVIGAAVAAFLVLGVALRVAIGLPGQGAPA
ncbi:MAG TPA: hypothetical protein VGF50_02935 [Caulobacteraceae bacterium]|jgi:hypothetical protein